MGNIYELKLLKHKNPEIVFNTKQTFSTNESWH